MADNFRLLVTLRKFPAQKNVPVDMKKRLLLHPVSNHFAKGPQIRRRIEILQHIRPHGSKRQLQLIDEPASAFGIGNQLNIAVMLKSPAGGKRPGVPEEPRLRPAAGMILPSPGFLRGALQSDWTIFMAVSYCKRNVEACSDGKRKPKIADQTLQQFVGVGYLFRG